MAFTDVIDTPHPSSINSGLAPCPTNLLIQRFGMPIARLPKDCSKPVRPSNAFWRSRFVTEDAGPFRVTGHRLAVGLLRESLVAVKSAKPDLHALLGTAGMLCMRHVRGHPGVPSNHALGLAIDFRVAGALDDPGDDKTYVGLLELYGTLKTFGWYWGAEFPREDSMHFEVSYQVVQQWLNQGIF